MHNSSMWFRSLSFVCLLCSISISCAKRQTSLVNTSAITPEITATSILFSSSTQDLISVLSETYHRSESCLVDNESKTPHNTTGSIKPEFTDITNEDGSSVLLDEIADNANNTYRAYLLNICNKDMNCTSQLQLENKLSGQRYLVTWEGFEIMTAHWNLIWIGEDIVAYMHLLDARREEIIAINVKTKDFAYVGQTWAECVEP